MNLLTKYAEAFIELIYPRVCQGCGHVLQNAEKHICTPCLASIPFTNYEKTRENPVHQLFWGRIAIENATALYFYEKDTRYQKLMHHFKYHKKTEIGKLLGKTLAYKLKQTPFEQADMIVPVPLHQVKQRQRGFNQSEVIANAVGNVLRKPVDTISVTRNSYSKSQTKKHRYERWENMQGIFECKKPDNLKNKHILIIDDVVTTGATIESLGNEILKIPGTKISLATLAVAPA